MSNNVIRKINPDFPNSIDIIGNGRRDTIDNTDPKIVSFDNPFDVTVDVMDNIYVSDFNNYCIRKIEKDLSVHRVAGIFRSPGNPDNKPPLEAHFQQPNAIAADENNKIYIMNLGVRLHKIDFQSIVTTIIKGDDPALRPLNEAVHICYSKKRDSSYPILIANPKDSTIIEVNDDGKLKVPKLKIGFKPYDLDVDETGNIIVLSQEAKRFLVIYKNDTIKPVLELDHYNNNWWDLPSGIAIDTKRKIIYISDERGRASGEGTIIKAKYE